MYGRFAKGRGNGAGCGFRGYSPPYPYIGRGRGGLSRCGYFMQQGMATGAETSDLNSRASLVKEHLAQIKSRIEELKK
ncbi:MAG: hypothetical protein PHY25_00305 [Dehalococcoidales bacterium]|nr:hypothetical protein [Dehalococcoidales bacterium]MDD4465116.1 hypothetical protein [Dehalococcoidales bacterium]